ncbi:hypothetical protein T440DRAFT_117054 [Plenodomus tracheiphilus IPT5]|uniref:Uncharacterized protein n=1 Tax=Plenodomus tracheiphilus IPT5 TaxID=1408161 RepID=A0A6A7ALE6_9PLEO|nr:hypothetical protein T440DRAFT_117054 [Plenodomus tracheiphilus IPT5]
MQPKSLGQYNWLLDAIEAERASFDDEKVPLLSCHAAALKTAIDLLLEDEVSLEKRSKQRRCERLKARTLLVDIYTGVSPEVFMLCIFATTITKLEKVPPKVAVPKLRALSKTKPLPKGLIETTMELCNAYSIDALISSHKADISRRYVFLYVKVTNRMKVACLQSVQDRYRGIELRNVPLKMSNRPTLNCSTRTS